MHAVPASVHCVPLVQQAWFSLPHSQTPPLHVPEDPVVGFTQAAVSATQRFDEQHAVLSMHVLLAQHGFPVTPHGRQMLLVVSHDSVLSPHFAPVVQQGSPAPPHFRH